MEEKTRRRERNKKKKELGVISQDSLDLSRNH